MLVRETFRQIESPILHILLSVARSWWWRS